jgi:eukaryotic-like serine/threonine-protein kinase
VGEEKSIPKSDPAELKNSLDTEGAQTGATAGGEVTLDTAASLAAAAQALGSIGPYVFVKKLGEGGMGLVWLAEQTAPVTRQVAVKLIKGGLYDSAVIQRFESERQSLAVMNHPAIAKVFDAGSTKDGQPYFVMEYVNGPPITTYCDNKKLKIRERLELFIKVCEGVQHAHQKAVIHRDLKPSNVLVSEVDGKPLPRIIDFGIAKAISAQGGGEKTMLTQMGALVGTPGFISPEQADPSVLDVDTRTDVYSLGVILYILLTGTLPFDQARWKKKRLDEILRELREEDPPSPSTRLREEPETATESAAMRATEPRQLVSMLRGDLDWITMKALEKDRARRYGTPSDLAVDIERYLENRPVIARPATTGYRLKKYVQRHRVGVAAASGVGALLLAFAITQTVQLRRITRERDRANRITSFMKGMFKVSDPNEARGNNITAREILDKAYQDIDTGLAKDPELQAEMMSVMGDVYVNLGLYGRAEPLMEKSTEIQRRLAGAKSPETLEAADRLAYVLALQGHYAEAEKLQRETLEIRRKTLGPQNVATAATILHLGTTLGAEGHFAEAEKLERESLEIRQRVLGLENTDTLNTMGNLANVLQHQGRYAEAEKLDRQTLEIRSRVLGPEHLDTAFALASLSWDLYRQGRLADAEKLQKQAVDVRRRILGAEHPDTLSSIARLAVIIKSEGRFAEAEKLQRETLEIRRRVQGPEHPNTVLSMGSLAGTLQSEGKLDEAEKLYRQELGVDRRTLGPESEDTLSAMSDLATVLGGEERYAEGEKLIREVLAIELRVLGPDAPLTANTRFNLAMFAALRGQRDEPLALLREAIDHGLDVNNMRQIANNPNFTSLSRDPRFVALVQHAQERIAAAKKPN